MGVALAIRSLQKVNANPAGNGQGQFMVQRETIQPWDPSVIWKEDEVAQAITDKAVEYIKGVTQELGNHHSFSTSPTIFLMGRSLRLKNTKRAAIAGLMEILSRNWIRRLGKF